MQNQIREIPTLPSPKESRGLTPGMESESDLPELQNADIQPATEEDTLPELKNGDIEILTKDELARIQEGESIHAERERDERALFEATVLDTVKEAVAATDAVETKASKQMNKHIGALAETAASFDAPSALFEDAPSFVEDATHAFVGTAVTGRVRRAFHWLMGKPSQAPQEREHFGLVGETIRGIPGVARTLPETALSGMANIARDVAQRFNEWSPDTLEERARIAKTMEEDAQAVYSRVTSRIQTERAALYRLGKTAKASEGFAHLDNVGANAEQDYKDTLATAADIAPGALEHALKAGTWAAASVSLDMLSFTVGIGGIVEEAARNFFKGVRGERRKLIEERMMEGRPLDTHENTVITRMERLGDLLATKAEEMKKAHYDLVFNIDQETSHALKQHMSLARERVEQRIIALTEKTKLTQADTQAIKNLTSQLQKARQGSLSSEEIHAFIQQAKDLENSKREDEQLLMGYIAGRAINSLKELAILPLNVRNALIAELREKPSLQALKTAEAALNISLYEDASILGISTHEESKKQAQAILADLKENIRHATETYNASISKISGELAKAFQAANRETKKDAARVAAAGSDERMAA